MGSERTTGVSGELGGWPWAGLRPNS